MIREKLFYLLLCSGLLSSAGGCQLLLPEKALQPVIRNPFPQLSRVAVAPFFNQSDEPTVDGRAIAMAYFAELQSTPGFEVVPVGVVEEAMIEHRIDLSGAGEARRLAGILEVDAVVVGSVTDYSPYYPPRCGLRVEWYTANPGFHEIPAGYGLPWNTPEAEFIPDSLVYESQMALARSQMQSLAPICDAEVQLLPAGPSPQSDGKPTSDGSDRHDAGETRENDQLDPFAADDGVTQSQHLEPASAGPIGAAQDDGIAVMPPSVVTGPTLLGCQEDEVAAEFYLNGVGECMPFHGPVLRHTNIYRASDPEFSEALRGYAFFQDDQRIGGWQSYLHRSDDFVRICCHMHISEMLSARGGSRKTRVVWRWPDSR